MTITDAISAPLVAVVGATGNQGGSVVKALEESDTAYRIRAFTRDTSKPAAQALASRGVQVVTLSLMVENKEQVYKAFEGAKMAFLVTNFWEHMKMEREIAEGKLLIDAAKAGGAERIVWSGLPSFDKLSGGRLTHTYHFDGKAIVTEYARQIGAPFVDVQAGFYGMNNPLLRPKLQDGLFTLEWPVLPTTPMPVIDAGNDYGLFVRQVFELPVFPSGSEVRTAGELIPVEEMVRQIGQVTGKEVVLRQITFEDFSRVAEAVGLPPHIAEDATDCWIGIVEYGYYGAKGISSHEGLARKPRTWKDIVASDWSQWIDQ